MADSPVLQAKKKERDDKLRTFRESMEHLKKADKKKEKKRYRKGHRSPKKKEGLEGEEEEGGGDRSANSTTTAATETRIDKATASQQSGGEPSSSSSSSSNQQQQPKLPASYQHPPQPKGGLGAADVVDLEAGGGMYGTGSDGNGGGGHVFLLSPVAGADDGSSNPRLLREHVHVHQYDDEDGRIGGRRGGRRTCAFATGMLHETYDRLTPKQRAAFATAMVVLLYWWL